MRDASTLTEALASRGVLLTKSEYWFDACSSAGAKTRAGPATAQDRSVTMLSRANEQPATDDENQRQRAPRRARGPGWFGMGRREREQRPIRMVRAITVKRPRPQVYAFWKN